MNIVYIYGITCPKSKEVMYVGKTKNIVGRMRAHFSASRKTNPWNINAINVWIKTFEHKKTKPNVVIICECFDFESSFLEKFWIKYYSSLNPMLLNSRHNPNSKNNIWNPIRISLSSKQN